MDRAPKPPGNWSRDVELRCCALLGSQASQGVQVLAPGGASRPFRQCVLVESAASASRSAELNAVAVTWSITSKIQSHGLCPCRTQAPRSEFGMVLRSVGVHSNIVPRLSVLCVRVGDNPGLWPPAHKYPEAFGPSRGSPAYSAPPCLFSSVHRFLCARHWAEWHSFSTPAFESARTSLPQSAMSNSRKHFQLEYLRTNDLHGPILLCRIQTVSRYGISYEVSQLCSK